MVGENNMGRAACRSFHAAIRRSASSWILGRPTRSRFLLGSGSALIFLFALVEAYGRIVAEEVRESMSVLP
jgi:hypothetical protein